MSNGERGEAPAGRAKARRLFWITQARVWHWMTGALTLTCMLLFAVTGVTLNHAGQIEARPSVTRLEKTLPADLLSGLNRAPQAGAPADLPGPVADWLVRETPARLDRRAGEWSDAEVYIAMPRPGTDAWLSIDRQTGAVVYEATERGIIAWLNDLHTGRNAGPVWFWFIDVFAGAAVLFCLTGLALLWMHASRRPPTWALVGAGLAIPALIALFLVHA